MAVLPDAGLADEHGIVFGAAGEHLHDAADFVVAADDGVDLALPRQRGEVAAVFFERLVFALGVLVGDALRAAHLLERLHELSRVMPASLSSLQRPCWCPAARGGSARR